MAAAAAAIARPRPFLLFRHHDVSGVSGTGVVAEGIEWTDGTASMRWRGDRVSTSFYPNGLISLRAIHGHGRTTEAVYLGTASIDGRISTASVDGLCPRCGAAWPCIWCPT